jgi:hypothetical protein
MSKAGLVTQCGWAFRNDLVPKVIANVPMKYGSAFHEVVAASLESGVAPKLSLAALPSVAEKFDVDVDELRQHTQDAYLTLCDWLGGRNAWSMNLLPAPKGAVVVEKAIAYDTATDTARLAPPVDENHVYHDVNDDEHPGTVDVAINLRLYPAKRIPARFRKAVIILDHKTGMSFDTPSESAQLKSLAVAFARLWGCDRAIVGINHAPRGGIPAVFADELGPEELAEHARKLQAAFPRIGDGSLRPGPECGYCAGNTVCPAYGGSLAALTKELRYMDGAGPIEPLVQEARAALGQHQRLDLNTPEGLGTLHMVLQMMGQVKDTYTDILKQKIRDGMLAQRPDGKFAVLRTIERDNLSLASIKRAFKKPGEAAKIEKMLRDGGAIEKLPREELRAVDDR